MPNLRSAVLLAASSLLLGCLPHESAASAPPLRRAGAERSAANRSAGMDPGLRVCALQTPHARRPPLPRMQPLRTAARPWWSLPALRPTGPPNRPRRGYRRRVKPPRPLDRGPPLRHHQCCSAPGQGVVPSYWLGVVPCSWLATPESTSALMVPSMRSPEEQSQSLAPRVIARRGNGSTGIGGGAILLRLEAGIRKRFVVGPIAVCNTQSHEALVL